jgi:outer membrane protein assembly factor BamB
MWRGPRGDGTSLEKDVPTQWSTTQNIAWKTAIPGKGHASPIVWNGRVFVVTADKEKKQRLLLCLDRSDGNILWQQVVLEAPLERINSLNSYASSTPAADGLVYFLSDKGVMTIVRPGPKPEIVAHNELGEETYASPALSAGQICLRGVPHLYCIRNSSTPK